MMNISDIIWNENHLKYVENILIKVVQSVLPFKLRKDISERSDSLSEMGGKGLAELVDYRCNLANHLYEIVQSHSNLVPIHKPDFAASTFMYVPEKRRDIARKSWTILIR